MMKMNKDVIVKFLEKSPYTTPDGKVLSGENADEFIDLFFGEDGDE
jgi:hypothetical protein